jgi:hypothetical protein
MPEGEDRIFEEGGPTGTFGGDSYVGVPIDREIVEEVAAERGLEASRLARVLRDAEQASGLLSCGVVFSDPSALPVGGDERGHIYVATERPALWDMVGDRLGLTDTARDAVEAAHLEQVRRCELDIATEVHAAIVVLCPDFPAGALDDIRTIAERTDLSGRQATVWALSQQALAPPAIADILELSETNVEEELAEVDRETKRVTEAAEILDLPRSGHTRLKPSPVSDEWLGLEWSPWSDLRDRPTVLKQLPREPGLYRVRHTKLPGLLYVGETGAEGGLRSRVGHDLAAGLAPGSQPEDGKHGATEPLHRICDVVEGELQVSVTSPPVAANRRYRRSLEAALVAVCRRETGHTPGAMLNRSPVRDSDDEGVDPVSRSSSLSRSPPDWKSWRSPTSRQWMGFNWTRPRPLARRGDVGTAETCAVRVWADDDSGDAWGQRLIKLGTTESLKGRLFSLESTYGEKTMFSVAPIDSLSPDSTARLRVLEEVRYDLIGAHHLATGGPPSDQFRS